MKNAAAAVPASSRQSGDRSSSASELGQAGKRLGGLDVCVRDRPQRLGLTRSEHREQRRKRDLEPLGEIERALPVVRPQALDRGLAPVARGDVLLGALKRRLDGADALAEVYIAEGGDLERTPGATHAEGVEPEPRQRMLQKCHHVGRREGLGYGCDRQVEEGARHRLGERAPGGVVDADAPGLKPNGDAAREQSVGRDECRGTARSLCRLAQNERHDLGFVLCGGSFD